MVLEFDEKLVQLHQIMKETQASHRRATRTPWKRADKRHSYATGLTLVDALRARREGRGPACDLLEHTEEGAPLVE